MNNINNQIVIELTSATNRKFVDELKEDTFYKVDAYINDMILKNLEWFVWGNLVYKFK